MQNTRILALISLAAVPFAASAADLGLAKNFNAFVFNNYSATSDSEGSVAVGGNFTGSQNNAMHQFPGTLGTATNIGLYVGGTYNASVNGNAGANVYLANKTGGNVNNSTLITQNAGNTALFNSMSASFGTTTSKLKSQSLQINTLAQGAGVVNVAGIDYSDQNHAKLNGVDLGTQNNLKFPVQSFSNIGTFGGTSVYVFNITDAGYAQLTAHNPILEFTGLDATHTLLLNFTGTNVNFTPQIQTNSSNQYTLFNFANATAVHTPNTIFTGSILAPLATVTQGSGDIQGNLIAKNFIQGNELHWDAGNGVFHGWVPTAAVPEPGTWAALGLGAAALLRRRRK